MKDYIKKYIKTIRLNSFHPLCETEIGKRAVQAHGFPPFIDASCRREPDFENPNPSITSLCRQELFAPNLYPNDIVVYMTVKGKWLTDFEHYRLIAILEVIERKDSHLQAKSWYINKGLRIPSNCMVEDNPPHAFDETGGRYEDKKTIKSFLNYAAEKQRIIGSRIVKKWDEEYLAKSKKWRCFIITKPVYVNVTDPPVLTEENLFAIFGKKVNTRNPNIIKPENFKELAKHAGINFIQPK